MDNSYYIANRFISFYFTTTVYSLRWHHDCGAYVRIADIPFVSKQGLNTFKVINYFI